MENQKIGVIKLDSLGVILTLVSCFILIFVFLLGTKLGVIEEKISSLEDVVFNNGVYEKLKQEVSYDVQGRT